MECTSSTHHQTPPSQPFLTFSTCHHKVNNNLNSLTPFPKVFTTDHLHNHAFIITHPSNCFDCSAKIAKENSKVTTKLFDAEIEDVELESRTGVEMKETYWEEIAAINLRRNVEIRNIWFSFSSSWNGATRGFSTFMGTERERLSLGYEFKEGKIVGILMKWGSRKGEGGSVEEVVVDF